MDGCFDGHLDVPALHCVHSVVAAVKPEEEPPSQPILGELRASQVTPDSVQLEWSVPEGTFDSFTVQYKDGEGQPQVVPVDGGSRKVTVPGLSPSRRYKFNLYGVWGRKRLGPVSTDAVTGEESFGPHQGPLWLLGWDHFRKLGTSFDLEGVRKIFRRRTWERGWVQEWLQSSQRRNRHRSRSWGS
ncbi:tenascin-X-like [Podargus strigoides]